MPRGRKAVHTYAGPVSRSSGSLSLLDGHTMPQACCASSVVSLGGSGEVLSQDGQRRRTVDSVKLGKALFGLIVLHKRRIFWRQGERNWPILKSGTTGSTEGPIVPMIGRTTTFYPSILRLYRRGGLLTAARPQSDIGKRMGCVPCMSSRSCLHDFRCGGLLMQLSRPTRGDSLLLIRAMAVFQLRVFDVAVPFSLVVLLPKYKVLTALPLGWHSW